MIIVHDPGHGAEGRPRGTEHGDLVERDWVLQMAQDLRASIPWCTHHLLRTGENGPGYDARASEAEKLRPGLVICHHVNAASAVTLDGLMCFYVHGDHIGREAGEAIMRAAPADLRRTKPWPFPSRLGDWTADAYSVLHRYRERGLSVVLVEWGFATAPRDYAVLMSPASRPALCAAGAAGIARSMELTHPG